MFELWARYPWGWRWRMIGAETVEDLFRTYTDHGVSPWDVQTLELRVINCVEDRPGVVL